MSNILWKKFNLCFSTIKCLSPPPPPLPPPSPPLSPPPKEDQNHMHSSSTKSIMIKNFNSLYDLTSTSTSKSHTDDFLFSSSADELSDDSQSTKFTPPDFATLFASPRFFFSSPGRSNSIFECSSSSPESTQTESNTLLDGGVAFSKYSPDPYTDFRRSMQEMVEARDHELVNVKDNCEYLHELLSCYLNLNPKHTHKYIISAFADLVVALMPEKRPYNLQDQRRHHVSRRLL